MLFRRINKYFLLFICYLWLHYQFNLAQLKDIKFEKLTGDDGLPSGSVYCIFKDTKGFIWFGTGAGLARFDGYDFKVYNTSPDKPGSISYNEVRCIIEDSEGYLWCGTDYGLNKLDKNKDSFTVFKNDPNGKASISDNNIAFIIEEKEKTFWVGTRNGGLNKFDQSSGTFTVYRNIPGDTNSLSNDLIWSGYIDREGELWVGTMGRGLNKFNKKNNNFDHFLLPFTEFPDEGMITSINEDIKKNIWVGTTEGLCKLTPVQSSDKFNRNYKIKRYFFDPPRFINGTYEDEYNNIWICGADGLIIFNPETEYFTTYKNISGDPHSLISSHLSAIYQDSEGVIWLQSDKGVSYYNKNKWKFNSLFDFEITKISEYNKDNLFLGSYQGLYSFNRLNKSEKKMFYYEKLPDSWQHNLIYSISPVVNNLLLFSMGPFFYACEFKNGNIISSKNVPDIWIATAICTDHDGLFWLSISDNGIKIIDNDLSEIASIQNTGNDSTSTSKGTVTAIYEDKDNVMWIGTSSGLDKVITERRRSGKNYSISFNIRHYKHKIGDTSSISSDVVSYLYEDNKENLWVGTIGGGLNKFDKKLDEFTYYTVEAGLPDNMIMGILPDNNGNLWISTFKGLSRFNPETEQFKNYNKMDGLPSDQFFINSCCKTSDGEMYFGSMHGLISFYPDSIKDNSNVPPVVLTSFKIFNKEADLEKSVLETDEIKLSYRDNFFSIEFSALDYTNPMKNQYMYMLEGIDKGWVKTPSSKREASYTDIDPGEYVFRVKGSNNDGIWNEEGASVKIIITPPWWKTWWFTTCALIFLAGIFGGTIRYVSVQKLKRKLALEQERSRISKDMHDDVGSSLTKIAILSQLTKQKVDDPEHVKTNVEKISDSANEVVDNISEIIWALNPKNDTLDNLLAYIREYASEFFELKSIDYKITLPENIPTHHLSSEIRRNIFLVIKEALNNIVKYAKASFVNITAKFENGSIEMAINDNGRGFDINNTKKFGNGLINMRKRIEDINGKLDIQSKQGKGTVINFKVNL